MKPLMIRHPISWGNVNQKAQDNNGEIHPRGHKQITELLERMGGEKVDRLYSSDSTRCRKLSQELGSLFDLKPEYSPLFREICNGDWAHMEKSKMGMYRLKNETTFSPPNGESIEGLFNRAKIASEYLQQEGVERIALVSLAGSSKHF